MRQYQALTMTELNLGMCGSLVRAPRGALDVVSTVDVQIHNVIAEAETMEWSFDMKDLWLTPSRWTMMCNQYLDREELKAWLERCTGKIGTKGRGIAVLRTKVVQPRGGAATGHTNRESRRWGSCMLAVSYKAIPRPQVTLYSRTSYLGYLGGLDLSVAWMCGRYLAQAMGVELEDIAFVWYNEAIQFHNFKSMAFLLNHPNEDERRLYRRIILKKLKKLDEGELDLLNRSPALGLTRKWMANMLQMDKDGVHLGQMNYNTYRRIRRRYHTEVRGYEFAKQFEGWSVYKTGERKGENKEFFKAYLPLTSVPIETLSFSRLGLPLDGDWGVEYDESADDWDEDDEE